MVDAGGEPATTLTLHQAAALVGAYRWIEERLFALTGRWAADPAMTPRGQVHLFEASARHGWHAELWADRLPLLSGADPSALTRPPVTAVVAILSALEGAEAAAVRLVGLHGVVLPRLSSTYRRHLARTSPVADRPLERVLRLVLADLDEEQTAGAPLVGEIRAASGVAGRGGDGVAEPADSAAGEPGDVCLVPWPAPLRTDPAGESSPVAQWGGHPGSATGVGRLARGRGDRRA